MIAVVEKFAGKINAKIIPTGNHNGTNVSLKVTCLSRIRARYLATYTINTTLANADVWKPTPIIGILIQRAALAPAMVVP